jgi:hypothetical protein
VRRTNLPSKKENYQHGRPTELHGASTSVLLPTQPVDPENILEADLQRMVDGKWRSRIQKGTETSQSFLTDAGLAGQKIIESFGDITKLGIDKTTHNKSLLTIATGLGAGLAGLFSVRNIFKTTQTFIDPKSGGEVTPWPVYALMAILQGGLAAGLAAPFTGGKNPFMKIENGEQVVPIKLILGAIIGTIGIKETKRIAENVSIFSKIPFIGPALKDIFATSFSAVKQVSTPGEAIIGPGGAPQPAQPNLRQ